MAIPEPPPPFKNIFLVSKYFMVDLELFNKITILLKYSNLYFSAIILASVCNRSWEVLTEIVHGLPDLVASNSVVPCNC